MEMHFTKEQLFEVMPLLLDRLVPYIITDINNPVNLSLFQKTLIALEPYAIIEHIESPKKLFRFIKEHQKDLIVIKDDVFSKRSNYLEIVQGAVCSSPDSMALWTVHYLSEKEFIFKGKIILSTQKTEKEIKCDKRFSYFARDCNFI